MNLQTAKWIDVNTRVGLNTLPDRIPDSASVLYSSLFNLFNCPVGARARTFQPLYGSFWYKYLQEPVSEGTSISMRMSMLTSIAKWEPRIELDRANTWIVPDNELPGYRVRIMARMLEGMDTDWHSIDFDVPTL